MWRDRFDDLWLWAMPEWFVRACLRLGGTVVLDVFAILGVAGVGCLALWHFLEWQFAYWAGMALTFPSLFFLITTTVTRIWWNWFPPQVDDFHHDGPDPKGDPP